MLKIAHKIIFIYSAITLCAIGMAFAVLWYWMSGYADNLYYSFLEERAELIAQKNLERCSGNRVYDIYMEHRTDTVASPCRHRLCSMPTRHAPRAGRCSDLCRPDRSIGSETRAN